MNKITIEGIGSVLIRNHNEVWAELKSGGELVYCGPRYRDVMAMVAFALYQGQDIDLIKEDVFNPAPEDFGNY